MQSWLTVRASLADAQCQQVQLSIPCTLCVQSSLTRVGGGLSSVALGTVAATSWTTARLSQGFRCTRLPGGTGHQCPRW